MMIDPYLRRNALSRDILGEMNNKPSHIYFLSREWNEVQTLIFIFLHIKNYWQMIIRSTVSPILKIGFQLFGIWPGVSYSTIRSMSIISSILIIQYFQYLYIFNHFKISEISNLNDSLNLTFTYGLTVFKLIYLWIRRQ